MTCNYCNSAECLADATVERDGVTFPALGGDEWHIERKACHERTLQRALRAEAKVANLRSRAAEADAIEAMLDDHGWIRDVTAPLPTSVEMMIIDLRSDVHTLATDLSAMDAEVAKLRADNRRLDSWTVRMDGEVITQGAFNAMLAQRNGLLSRRHELTLRAERAEAELLAAHGDIGALTPFLGDWEHDRLASPSRWVLRRNGIVAAVRCGSRGAWGWCEATGEIEPDHRGVLSVMAQCEKALAEAQEVKQ